jgi:hypothetical protein
MCRRFGQQAQQPAAVSCLQNTKQNTTMRWSGQRRVAQALVSALSLFTATATASTVRSPISDEVGTMRAAQFKSRELLQAPAAAVSPVISYAKDADQLLYAFESAATDIELQDHIDLRDVEVDVALGGTVLPAALDRMRSFRVRFLV